MRVSITKKIFGTKLVIDKSFVVYNPLKEPDINANVRLEVGISNLIQLEYEIYQNKLHLQDCILGKIYFVKVNMKVRSMEINLIKKETIGLGNRLYLI